MCKFRPKLTCKLEQDLNPDLAPSPILVSRSQEEEEGIRNCLTGVYRVLMKFTEMY